MSADEFHRIISILRDWGICIIGLTGGEPLIRKDIDKIVAQYADDFTFVIFSSGYGLTLDRARQLKANGLWAIAISLDDYDRNLNDEARGLNGAFEISINAIKNAKEAGLYTVIQSVVTKNILENGRMENFLNFIKSLEPDEFLILEPLGTGRLINCNDSIFLKNGDRDSIMNIHRKSIHDERLPKIFSFIFTEHRMRYGCGAGIQHAYIDTNGNLLPCNFVPISLGNILKESNLVYERLVRYFSIPCCGCTLVNDHDELKNMFEGMLPIPFEKAQSFLEKRLARIRNSEKPLFFKKMERNL